MNITNGLTANAMLDLVFPQVDTPLPVYAVKKSSGMFVVPRAHVIEWFQHQGIPMKLCMEEYEAVGLDGWEYYTVYGFEFDSPENAMVFKLSWQDIEEKY